VVWEGRSCEASPYPDSNGAVFTNRRAVSGYSYYVCFSENCIVADQFLTPGAPAESPGDFTRRRSEIPGVDLSIHPARAFERRLPPPAYLQKAA
jgi:hypothetical protein